MTAAIWGTRNIRIAVKKLSCTGGTDSTGAARYIIYGTVLCYGILDYQLYKFRHSVDFLTASASTFGLPPVRPLALAERSPSRVRSAITSRSNCAMVLMRVNRSLPVDVLVSIDSLSDQMNSFALKQFRQLDQILGAPFQA